MESLLAEMSGQRSEGHFNLSLIPTPDLFELADTLIADLGRAMLADIEASKTFHDIAMDFMRAAHSGAPVPTETFTKFTSNNELSGVEKARQRVVTLNDQLNSVRGELLDRFQRQHSSSK